MREKYERINVGVTETVVETAIKAGARRVVLFSTIAVYGPSDGCVLNAYYRLCQSHALAQSPM